MTDFILLQLNDALFPIGSYTQSFGLETYVQKNAVSNAETFFCYLKNYLYCNVLFNDLLAVKLAYEAATENNLSLIAELEVMASATKIAREVREASCKMGSRFIKNVISLSLASSDSIFAKYLAMKDTQKISGHYAIAYATFSAALKLNIKDVLKHFLYAQFSGMVNTGVKLIPLSQTQGQQLLSKLLPEFHVVLDKLSHLSLQDFGRSTPGFELRCMQHERLYSRLYMS